MQLWVRLGSAVLAELNGMFAFVIYDTQSGQVFAARDRLGVKPLYYVQRGGDYTFSSEIAPLLELYPDSRWTRSASGSTAKLRTFFNGRTLYRDIQMFPAGHYLEEGRLHRCWDLPDGPNDPPSDEELRELVDSAVRLPQHRRRRGRAATSAAAWTARSWPASPSSPTPGPSVPTGTTSSRGPGSRPRSSAPSITRCSSRSRSSSTSPRDLITHRREPLSVPNEVQLYVMTREVREHNTVILSGEGADELFFGYDRVFRWAANAERFDLREFDRLYSYGSREDDEVLEDALSPVPRPRRGDRRRRRRSSRSPISTDCCAGSTTRRCAAASRDESRSSTTGWSSAWPGSPSSYRMAGGEVKAPLKRVFADLVPDAILERKKVGFPVDLERVFQDDAGQPADGPLVALQPGHAGGRRR